MSRQITRVAIFAAVILSFATFVAEARTITLACKLKVAGNFDSDYKQVDQIVIDTTKKSFAFRVANTKNTSRPLAWYFYDNWVGDGCTHMTFSENPKTGQISGALAWTCKADTRNEAVSALGITTGGFPKAAERQQRRNALLNPRHGFYVVVPPQFLSWGAPPPSWYIDDLMRHEAHPYYVGLLKAAELHGATHQAVMVFQVVTDKRIPKIHAGRSIISFVYRKDMDRIASAIVDHKTDTGRMKISSPELTALDLLRYAHVAGTIDSIATVLSDLGPKLRAAQLLALAPAFERSVIQRLGYLLDFVKQPDSANALHTYLQKARPLPWVELEPHRRRGKSKPTVERNARWNVMEHRKPELDE